MYRAEYFVYEELDTPKGKVWEWRLKGNIMIIDKDADGFPIAVFEFANNLISRVPTIWSGTNIEPKVGDVKLKFIGFLMPAMPAMR